MKPVGRAASAAYAAGSFGTGVFSSVPAVLLLYFCTEILHIPPAWAAVVLFVPKAWAIFWDPFVGSWSDRSCSPLGRRRPFLAAGAAGVALAFLALFSPPNLPTWATIAWVGGCYFGLATLYSVFAVPYIAIPAEIGQSEAMRARLVGWRMMVAMVGILAGGSLAPLLVQAGGGGRPGYRFMALPIAAACGVAMYGPFRMMRSRDRRQTQAVANGPGLAAQLRATLANAQFRKLLIAYLLQLTAIGVVTSSAPYLVTADFSRPDGDTGVAMGAMLAGAIASIPVWTSLGRRLGDSRAYGIAALLYPICTGAMGLAAVSHASWSLALATFAFAGIPFGGLQVLPFTVVAHLIHCSREADVEATFTGVWTAGEKLGLAFGPALTGIALSLGGGRVDQGFNLFLAAAPALLCLASAPLLRRFEVSPPAPEPVS